jgi:phospholipase/carboxylesterase
MEQDETSLSFVHRFVHGPGKRTLLLLHGTGGDETDLLPIGKLVEPNASLLSPRGKVLENGMPRYFRRFAEGVFDVKDLKLRTAELAIFVMKAADRYKFSTSDILALGFSNGANIAASLLFLRPEILQGAILIRSSSPFEPESIPKLSRKKVLMLSGRYDPITPREKVMELADLLKKSGATVALDWVEASHGLTDEDIHITKRWLSEFDKQ